MKKMRPLKRARIYARFRDYAPGLFCFEVVRERRLWRVP